MNLSRLQLSIAFFFVSYTVFFAQYTDVINSNKPGLSESPYSVGIGVYQFESTLFFRNTSVTPTFSIPESLGLDLFFRTSFFLEKLELNAQVTYQQNKVAFKNIFTSDYNSSGLSRMTVGAKYLLYQPAYEDKSKEIKSWRRRNAFDTKRLIPSVALYLGVNTGFINDIHNAGGMTPKVGILLQNNLSKDFNLISNIFYDNIGSELAEFSYIVTATQNFGGRWSAFLENQTIFQEYQNNINLGLGIAYLYRKDLQLNASGRFLSEGKSQGFYAGLGLSYRLNRHQDSFKELDDKGKELKDTPISKFNKKSDNFFSRFLNIFKKKDKKVRKRPKRTRKRKRRRKKEGVSGLFGKKKRKEKKVATETKN